MRRRAGLFILSFGLIGCAALQAKARPAEPGEVVLIGTPRLALIDLGVGACKYHLYVRIPNPMPEMYCPEVTIESYYAPPGRDVTISTAPFNTSVYEADCQPWTLGGWHRDAAGKLVEEPASGFDEYRRHYALSEGEWLFRVRARQGAVERVAEIRMSCMGTNGGGGAW